MIRRGGCAPGRSPRPALGHMGIGALFEALGRWPLPQRMDCAGPLGLPGSWRVGGVVRPGLVLGSAALRRPPLLDWVGPPLHLGTLLGGGGTMLCCRVLLGWGGRSCRSKRIPGLAGRAVRPMGHRLRAGMRWNAETAQYMLTLITKWEGGRWESDVRSLIYSLLT